MNTATKLIHSGKKHNTSQSVVPPIYQTATYYAPESAEEHLKIAGSVSPAHFYQRHGNPVNNQCAEVIAALEGTEAALLTSSGMGAISSAILSVVKAGDHIIAQKQHYSAANMFLRDFLTEMGCEITFVHQDKNEQFEAAIRPNTKLIYVETPSNPNLTLTDLEFVATLARKNGIVTICDNTFASPLNQQPHSFGIDIVVHSATKYLGGHSDLLAGAICASQENINKAWKKMVLLGNSLGAFDAWLLLRGLRTLEIRVDQINKNALELANYLENHPAIEAVVYCGLSSHPQKELIRKQMKGHTGMMCIEVKGMHEAEKFSNAQKVLKKLGLFANAASLGGVESLITHPATMWGTHHSSLQKTASGITSGMLRISVGIENIEDLKSDFENALLSII